MILFSFYSDMNAVRDEGTEEEIAHQAQSFLVYWNLLPRGFRSWGAQGQRCSRARAQLLAGVMALPSEPTAYNQIVCTAR